MTTPTTTPPPERSRRSLPTIRLEHLWVALALSVVGVFIGLVPTTPNDFWWHLKVGELIADGGIPTTNLFAWTLPADTPYVYQSWLGEWLFALLYRLGGLPLTVFARNGLGLAAFALVALEARQRSGSWRLAAGAVLLAAAMAINNLTTRTQNWSWVPFVLTFLVFSGYTRGTLRGRWLAGLPLLMLFWVNGHGAFVMGLLVGGAFVVGEGLRRLLRQPYALTWERLRALSIAWIAMIGATLVNPLGIGIFGYVQKLLEDSPSQSLIKEWQSPTPRTPAGMFFYLGILAVIAAFAFARRRPTITDVLLVCGLAWQAFVGIRYVVWFGMVALPIVAQCLAPPRPVFRPASDGSSSSSPPSPPPRRKPPSRRERGGGTVAHLVVLVGLGLAVVSVQPWFKPWLPLPQPYQGLFAPVPGAPLLFSSDTPVAATSHLQAEPCAGRLFNEMGYGSYLVWALYPPAQVFIDPRVELYPMSLWQDYLALTRGHDNEVEQLLRHYDIACVVLDRGLQPHLSEAMAALSGWQRTFGDDRSEVWRRVRVIPLP
ncbi:MAG: hypothetical protein HC884_15695 [Chloroflexaceae bacterium]|nr:hypothetical protein [Chloroflexaceae bacterium]